MCDLAPGLGVNRILFTILTVNYWKLHPNHYYDHPVIATVEPERLMLVVASKAQAD